MSIDLDGLFRQTARKQPDHPAIVGPGDRETSYAELDRAIDQTAQRLQQAGVKRGDCVGLHYPSGAQYIVLNYAAWRLDACVVPVATELAVPEKQELCREIALDWLISPRGKARFCDPFCRGRQQAISGEDILVAIESPRSRPAGFDGIHAAFIRFTSGTTGNSKGVVLSHETIRERIEAANEALRIGPDDRVLWLLSMAYHFAVSIVGYLSFGATIVLPSNHFAAAVVAACERQRATLMYASPAHWALLTDYPKSASLASLRLAVSTTSSLSGEIARKFQDRYTLPLTQALGIIEIGLPCINVEHAARKHDSVGRVLPAYEIRFTDVGLGESHREISFRGKGMLDAYYHPWRTRAEIMPDGWFSTGDVGELDADGCLYLRGRSKDVISVMGMKFFPQEVESVLCMHPAVAEASVLARRDGRSGETPYALVVCQPEADREGLEDELRHWCAGRLASYKVPETFEFVAVLRRTASGKLLRREVAGGMP